MAIFASNSGGLDGWKGMEHAVLGPHSSAPLSVAVGDVGSGGIASPSRGLREHVFQARPQARPSDVRRHPTKKPEDVDMVVD
jgi:hypothetical protein